MREPGRRRRWLHRPPICPAPTRVAGWWTRHATACRLEPDRTLGFICPRSTGSRTASTHQTGSLGPILLPCGIPRWAPEGSRLTSRENRTTLLASPSPRDWRRRADDCYRPDPGASGQPYARRASPRPGLRPSPSDTAGTRPPDTQPSIRRTYWGGNSTSAPSRNTAGGVDAPRQLGVHPSPTTGCRTLTGSERRRWARSGTIRLHSGWAGGTGPGFSQLTSTALARPCAG